MTRAIIFISCTVGLIFFFSSCGPNYIYEKQFQIANDGWTYNDSLQFEVNIEDTLQLYNLYLDIDHTTAFPNQNLYIRIHTQFPNGKREGKPVSVDLANKMGTWNGKCSGEDCQLRVFLQQDAFFDMPGLYQFTVAQHTRLDTVPAIKSLSLKVEDTGKQKQ